MVKITAFRFVSLRLKRVGSCRLSKIMFTDVENRKTTFSFSGKRFTTLFGSESRVRYVVARIGVILDILTVRKRVSF